MIFVSMSCAQKENSVIEQILMLKIQSPVRYYIAKFAFLCCISLIFTIVYTAFPVIQNILNGNTLFNRPLTINDVINAFILLAGSSISGAAMGDLFHSRVIKDRKFAIALTVFIAVIAVCRYQIEAQMVGMKYILWLFPPITAPFSDI